MSLSDPIADMIIRIKNAQMRKHPEVMMPASKLKKAVADVLVTEGYIKHAELVQDDAGKPQLRIELKYYRHVNRIFPVITNIRRVSKPSLRIYKSAKEIPSIRGGYGTAILSTTGGVMSGFRARKLGHGGEVICYVW
jgi:small subunit ribosomal protein S8